MYILFDGSEPVGVHKRPMKIGKNRQSMRPFSLLIKPASADCNLNCTYCFYLEKSKLYPQTKRHRMSDAVLEKMISTYMATSQPVYYFGWQGGEPTLMGLEFFQKAVDFQRKHGRSGSIVSNGLQTNATLIDDGLARLFSRYKFLVGVSIDGPSVLHDRYRRNIRGRGTHAEVLQGIECLKRHQVEFNALVLVSSANMQRAKEVYHYLCNLGIYHHQYIPCVEFDRDGRSLPYALSGTQWGRFLCEIFDEWIQKDFRKVSIRNFDSILNHMVEYRYTVCHQAGNCNQYFVVEYNGDVYPCDFFVERRKRLGNIMTQSWEALNRSPLYLSFGMLKADWNQRCTGCEYLRYCAGDCIKHRFNGDRNPRTMSRLCEGWQIFYRHALPLLEKIALELLNGRQAALPVYQRQYFDRVPKVEIGRNESCYCGSGKKFKYCHGVGKQKKKKRKK